MVDKKERSEKDENSKDSDINEDTAEKKIEKDCEGSCENAADLSQNTNTIEKLEQEVATLKDTLLRKLAESDNLRKRLEKEKNDAEKYANGKFAKDLLSVIDNFDRVTKNLSTIQEKVEADAALKPFFEGVLLCGKELLSVFKKHGITQVEVSEGTHFDPHYHQAMCEIESTDHEPGVVINVMQSGYVYHDRLLRPAMVSVAKNSKKE
ncbi:MAG: nucleotide exchange factor GrpE [Alphaproteobacteria bacterium]|nr:nucleotide exchange factor GrpE [Alphaproteobacteria bacterium]